MKKAKKSLISIFLNGFANIFSFKEYSRIPRRTAFLVLLIILFLIAFLVGLLNGDVNN